MEYYMLERGGNNSNPLVGFKGRSRVFNLPQPMRIDEPVELILADPIPRNPVMIDYHSMGGKHLISEKAKNALESVAIDGVQFIPAKVDVNGTFYDYFIIHAYREIECMDLSLSKVTIDEDDGEILTVKKIVLDPEKLGKYKSYERMIFVVEEYSGITLFHEKVRDAIMSIEPEGFRFIHVDNWSIGSAFD